MQAKVHFYGECERHVSISELSVGNLFVEYKNGALIVKTDDIKDRLFLTIDGGRIIVSDRLSLLIEMLPEKPEVNKNAIDFYRKFGFILPPYSQYEGVFMLTPYREFKFKNGEFTFRNEYPCFGEEVDFSDSLSTYFDLKNQLSFDILVSGGIDSSALLGFLTENQKISTAYMCQMSSFSEESDKAKRMCASKGVDFELLNFDIDMSNVAKQFLSETGELISDPISIVTMKLFESVSGNNDGKGVSIVDGQGADSLLSGLPLNKILYHRKRLSLFLKLLSPLSKIKVHSNRKGYLNRKIYRLTKGVKSLFQTSFSKSIIVAISEVDELKLEDDLCLENRLDELYLNYKCWSLVLKHFYMFDVLPAREMQKYLFLQSNNINLVAPFLDAKVISDLFYIEEEKLIVNGVFKHPITQMANYYWPGYFDSSNTSPFQVDYSMSHGDIKEYSIDFITAMRREMK